jgi:hypothetical protein
MEHLRGHGVNGAEEDDLLQVNVTFDPGAPGVVTLTCVGQVNVTFDPVAPVVVTLTCVRHTFLGRGRGRAGWPRAEST